MEARTVVLIGFEGVTALDVVGPLEVLAAARHYLDPQLHGFRYRCVVAGITRRSFRAESGVVLAPARSLRELGEVDTVIIPGGSGLRSPAVNRAVSRWLLARADGIRRIASVCTGIYGLAPTGLLDGKRAATHWQFAADVRRKFPAVDVDSDAIYVKDAKTYTSAGASSGIDLALALVEEDFGARVAMQVARELVVYMKRPGGQEQYSEPLHWQTANQSELADVATWALSHLRQDLSVEALARRACLSPRQFSRRFKAAFGETPAAFILRMRLDAARSRMDSGRRSLKQIAAFVGIENADVFRRAFERTYGLSPAAYRGRFGSAEAGKRRNAGV